MSTDIKISELNEINVNKTINQLIVNDRSNSVDPGITRRISISNLLPTYSSSDSNRRAIVSNETLISTAQSPGNETVDTNVIRNGAITGDKIANQTINTSNISITTLNDIALLVRQTIFRVGSLYITTENVNPTSSLGFGTWIRWGNGKAIVGVDEGDVDFNLVEKTGGSKVHTLAANEIPSHSHSIPSLTGSTNTTGSHTHNIINGNANGISNGGANNTPAQSTGGVNPGGNYIWQTQAAGDHSHSLSTNASNTGVIGGSQPHNNLQPYITTYIWKRTA